MDAADKQFAALLYQLYGLTEEKKGGSMDPAVPAVVSVIVTGVVSISSIFVPFVIEWRRWVRGKKAAEFERIDESTLDLLSTLANLRHWVIRDIEMSAQRPIQQVYTNLQVKHYAWERAVWSRLEADDRRRVRELRQRFEFVHKPDEFRESVSDLSDEILSLAYIATNRV